jgi:DNA transformation protein
MAARTNEFAKYCCELLSTAGTCFAKPMFGGYGISTGGLTIAILADLGKGETLWLKASPETIQLFESSGCQRFAYVAKGKSMSMGYYSAPEQAMESVNEMAPWARLALDAALAARQPMSRRAKK